MEKNEMKEKAIALQRQGYSLQQIADMLNSSKSSVHRLLKGEENGTFQNVSETEETGAENWNEPETFQPPVPKPNNQNFQNKNEINKMNNRSNDDASIHYYKLQERQMELEHEREIHKLQQKEKELELERLRLQNQQNSISEEKKQANEKLEREKKSLLKKFHRLIQELRDNCEGDKWSYKELEDYLERIIALKERIEDFILSNSDNNFEDYKIWDTLNSFEEYLSEVLDTLNEDDIVPLNYSNEAIENLDECLELEQFDEESNSDESEDEE